MEEVLFIFAGKVVVFLITELVNSICWILNYI